MHRLSDSILIAALIMLGTAVLFGCGKDEKSTDPQNNPPVINSLTAEPDTFVADLFTTITVIAEDPDGDVLHYQWEARESGFAPLPGMGNTVEITNCCHVDHLMTTMVLSTVDDGKGGVTRDSIQVWVVPAGEQ